MTIKSYVQGIRLEDMNTFDRCIRDYFLVKYYIDLSKSIPWENIVFDKYEVLHFRDGNKDQFVNKQTKEVLFEVGYLSPEFDLLSGRLTRPSSVWCEEYWRQPCVKSFIP